MKLLGCMCNNYINIGKPDVIGPSNLTAISSTTIRLNCDVTSSLVYTSQWYHNNTLLHNSSRITSYGDTLEITIVIASDAGEYYCVATNAAGTSTSTKGWLNVCGKSTYVHICKQSIHCIHTKWPIFSCLDCKEPFDGDFKFSLPRDVSENSLVGSVESTYQQYFKLVL